MTPLREQIARIIAPMAWKSQGTMGDNDNRDKHRQHSLNLADAILALTPTAQPPVQYMADRFEWAAPGDQQKDAWLVRFCDKDCGEAIFTGPDAEKEAREHWDRYAPAFNIYMFRLAKLAQPPVHAEGEG